LVQVTETEDVIFALVAVYVPDAVTGAATWQEDITVAVTLNEAVIVAARAGLEA